MKVIFDMVPARNVVIVTVISGVTLVAELALLQPQ
jgi:hypothetical protein